MEASQEFNLSGKYSSERILPQKMIEIFQASNIYWEIAIEISVIQR